MFISHLESRDCVQTPEFFLAHTLNGQQEEQFAECVYWIE